MLVAIKHVRRKIERGDGYSNIQSPKLQGGAANQRPLLDYAGTDCLAANSACVDASLYV